MSDVFLSYAEEDRVHAAQLAKALTHSGWAVWWDREILPGRSYRDVIDAELHSARCVIVLWSRSSIGSRWVCDEADEAIERNALIQVVIDEVRPPRGFRQHQTANLVAWAGNSEHEAFRFLKKAIGEFVLPGSADPPSPQPSLPSAASILAAGPTFAPPQIVNQSVRDFVKSFRAGHKDAAAHVDRPRILLSYRREDAQDSAGRLHDRLVEAYGSQAVFTPIESISFGANFRDHVRSELGSCRAVIVLIGRHWLGVRDPAGRRALDSEDDHVRTEVTAALAQNLVVIPVLVQDTDMPREDDLPENIRPLARRNGISLSATRWRTDVERLIKELDRVMKK